MSRHVICPVDELQPGQRKIVQVRGRSIGVFNVNGTYHALLNRCPHRAAPLCLGPLTGVIQGPERYVIERTREGEVLRCPWHGWEFDLTNGHSLFNPHRVRARSYDVAVEPAALDDLVDSDLEMPAEDDAASAGARFDGDLVLRTVTEDEDDPSIETFPVAVEQEVVVLYLGRSKPARLPAEAPASAPTTD